MPCSRPTGLVKSFCFLYLPLEKSVNFDHGKHRNSNVSNFMSGKESEMKMKVKKKQLKFYLKMLEK